MPVILSSKSKRTPTQKQTEDLIATSLKRFKITAEAESEWRSKGLEDLKFSIGTGQWDEAVKSNREIEGKPCLTINRAPAFLRQYTGEERQHRPAMLVSPNGSGADLEVAKIHQGVLRHIEVVSEAEFVYDYSYDMGLRVGSHPWRIKTEYVSERSFDQEPRIEALENGFNYYGSPIRRPDGTDPLWAHVICDYSKDEYVAEFGKTQLAKLRFPTTAGSAEPGWVTKDGARVAEYWWIELTPKKLFLLDDGRILTSDERGELPKNQRGFVAAERDTILRTVHCVKHDAIEILKTYSWLGKYIPFPEFNAQRLNVNGKIYRAGIIRDYRDSQRIYDWMVTRAVEQIDMCSKDPLWVAEENAQWENDYRQMNRKNYSHLYYKAFDKNGRQLPPPQRAGREAPIQAMRELIQQADYDMKAVIGIYGPGLGEEAGNEQESGFAIMTRQQQSDTGMLPFHDNLNRAIKWQGRILLDLWPKLIDSARVQRIINPDDSVKHQVIFNSAHSPLEDGQVPEEARQLLNQQLGLRKAYDVGVGEYDIALSTGPMYKTARQEAFKALTAVIGEDAQMLLPILGDIWAKNADFPDAQVIEQRLRKLLPPNLQDQDDQDLQAKLAQASSALQALSDQHNQLVAELNRASDTIRTKRLDLESKERVALWNNWTQLMLQRLKSHDAAAQSLMDAELRALEQRMLALNGAVPIEAEAGPAPQTPELPSQVEPRVQPIVPASPTPRPTPIV